MPCLPGTGGGGGTSSVVYGQNGTAAMSTSNPFADNIVQFGGVTVSLGAKASTASIPTVDATLYTMGSLSGGSTVQTLAMQVGAEYLATPPTRTSGTAGILQSDVNGNLKVATVPPSSVPSAIASSLPALGATPTLVAAAGGITQGFTIQNNSTAPAFWSVTAASGTTLTYLNAETLAVGASFTSPPNMPMGGVLQVQSTTATACTVSATTGCIEGEYK